jgi:lysophospholipase L1-like esterase
MKLTTVTKSLVVVLLSIAFCLAVLEGAVRVYSAVFFPRMMLLDETLGWKHAANVSKPFVNEFGENALTIQNEYGHRGKTYPLTKATGKYRILVLGDSFTEAVQVSEDDLFTSQLEASHDKLEVLNAGVGGYGTVQEYLYLARDGLRFNPDLVLLMVFENDLSDNCLSHYPGFGPRPYGVFAKGEVTIVEQPDPKEFLKYTLPSPFAFFLSQHSYLFYFLNDNVYHKLYADRMRQLHKADLQKTENCGKYDVFYATITKIRQLLGRQAIALGLVLIPSKDNVAKGYSEILHPIEEYCQRQQIACRPLLDRFKKEQAPAQLYFPIDIHWTKAGHRVAADEIGQFVNMFARAQSLTKGTPRNILVSTIAGGG